MLLQISTSTDIFAFFIMIFSFIAFVYRSFCSLIDDNTLLKKLIINSVEQIDENTDINTSDEQIYLQHCNNYFISVIYRCESEAYVVREQIVCLSHVLSKQLHFFLMHTRPKNLKKFQLH